MDNEAKMPTIVYEEMDSLEIRNLIKTHASFQIIGAGGRMNDTVSEIENMIEAESLSCRIYTYGRVGSAAASFLGGPAGVLGVLATVGMGIHNIATYNPDYEIAKHFVSNKLTVSYKK